MTSSPRVYSLTWASPPVALSATTQLPTMDSRTARQHASLAGASLVALTAPSLLRMTLPLALVLQLELPLLALSLLPLVDAPVMTRLPLLILRMLVRSKMHAARRPLA